MSETDVVTDLMALADSNFNLASSEYHVLRRARDEIAALRQQVDVASIREVADITTTVRNVVAQAAAEVLPRFRAEILEQAAAECDQMDRLLLGARECAAAIRALKDGRHE